MNANALRSILLVKSVEEHDPDGALLPLAEREAATRDALRANPAAGPDAGEERAWKVLAERAAALQERLGGRHPVVERALQLESALGSAAWLVLPGAFALGLALSLLDSRVRIEILAFPLLGVVAWNLAVYAVLLIAAARGSRSMSPTAPALAAWTLWPAKWGWQRASRLIKQSSFYHRPLSAALRDFSTQWWPQAQSLLSLQGQRLFHVGSAAIALGLVAGFYLRGIALEYRAGWESTFLGPEQVRALLGWVYGPASAATGIELPADSTAMNALHWRNGQGGGPAAPWIHLMAATAILYVVIPRTVLALVATMRLHRAAADVARPESLLTYARSVLGASDAALPSQVVRLTAFAYEPGAAAERGLQRLLRAAFGNDARVEFAPMVPYGDEAAFESRPGGSSADIDVLLFNLASTPEVENHGSLLRHLHSPTSTAPAKRHLVLIDESAFLARMGGDASMATRVDQRRDAWRGFVRDHGGEACLVDLAAVPDDGPVDAALIERVQRSCRNRVA